MDSDLFSSHSIQFKSNLNKSFVMSIQTENMGEICVEHQARQSVFGVPKRFIQGSRGPTDLYTLFDVCLLAFDHQFFFSFWFFGSMKNMIVYSFIFWISWNLINIWLYSSYFSMDFFFLI